MDLDAVVLAGGGSARMGEDKALAEVGGVTLIARVLAAAAGCRTRVVVGPRRRGVEGDLEWVREDPPGAGPVHALAAGLARGAAPWVAVLACDLPFVGRKTLVSLRRAAEGRDGALATAAGIPNPLCAVYRRDPLAAALGNVETQGASMRSVTAGLDLALVPDEAAARDCDTPADLVAARHETRRSISSTY